MSDNPEPGHDIRGNKINPGDRVVHDMLGRPIRVHPSKLCSVCREIRGFEPVCPHCGTVHWWRQIKGTLAAAGFVAVAFAGWNYLGSPWSYIVFWVFVVIGGLWALESLPLWIKAIGGVIHERRGYNALPWAPKRSYSIVPLLIVVIIIVVAVWLGFQIFLKYSFSEQ